MAVTNAPAVEKKKNAKNENVKKQDAKAKAELPAVLPAEENNQEEIEEKANPILVVAALLAILLVVVLIVFTIFFIFVKYDVNGFAAKNLSTIRNIPILNQAIPEKYKDENTYIEIPDTEGLSNVQLRRMINDLAVERQQIINNVDALQKQINEYKKQITEMNDEINNTEIGSNQKLDEVNAKIAQLEEEKLQLEKDKAALEKEKTDFENKIIIGDREGLAMYFEKTNPELAAQIYQEWLDTKQIDIDLQNFLKTIQMLDAKTASKILEEMGKDDYDGVIEIFKRLKKDLQAEILTSMTSSFAAKVTKSLADLYMK